MKKNILLSWVAIGWVAMTAMSCSNKEDYEGLGHNYGTTQYAKVTYKVTLNDPHVMEAADILVSYTTIDGSRHEDTLRTATWQQPVRVPWSKDMTSSDNSKVPFGLALHYLSKSHASLTHASYDFGVTLEAPMYTYDEKGDSILWGSKIQLHPSGLLSRNSAVIGKDSLLMQAGRDLVDTTGVYYNQVSSNRYSQWKDSGPYVWNYGETAQSQVNYTLKITDPNVLDFAYLMVCYQDADGQVKVDTVRSLVDGTWTLPVRYRYQADGMTYHFAARFMLRDEVDRLPDGEGLNFHIDITSPMWYLDRKWDRKVAASLASLPDENGGLMAQKTQTILSDTLKTPQGRQLVNDTYQYYNITLKGEDQITSRGPLVWRK